MTIRTKIILITVFGLLLTVAVLGGVSVNQAEDILKQHSYESLVSKRDSKIQQLHTYFNERVGDISVLVQSLDVIDLTRELTSLHEHNENNQDKVFHMQEKIIKMTSAHHHNYFTNYIKEYDYDNLLLIDADDGHVLYSTVNDIDYGQGASTKKINGNSSVYQVWKKVKMSGKAAFVDMQSYGPGDDAIAMFLGAPVFVDGALRGIVIFHISLKEINHIMGFREGYKETQHDYLVGQDRLLRSNILLDKDRYTVVASFKNKRISKINTVAVNKALSGHTDIEIIKNSKGKSVLSAYAPLRIEEDILWAMVSEICEDEIMVPIMSARNKMLIISSFLFVLMSTFIYFMVNRNILRPLNDFQEGLVNFFKYLNKESRRVPPLNIRSNDEIGYMAKVINENITKTKAMIASERELSEHDKQLTKELMVLVEENEKHTWIKDGVALLHEKLSGNLNALDVSKISITHVCEYLNADVGVLYSYDDESKILAKSAGYAHKQKEDSLNVFSLGEGSVGEVALQRSPVIIQGLKQDELSVETGIASKTTLNISLFPLVYKDELLGVIEIGSIELLDDSAEEFLTSSSVVIATALASSIQAEKVRDLLEDAKLSNYRLQQQQQLLEESNAQMEEQQQQLEESNAQMEEHRSQLEKQNEALIESQNMLDQKARDLAISNKYKSEFLANMSHELRTPLNSIILLSDMLQENASNHLDEDEIKKAKIIYSSGNDLLKLIGDVLDLSKIEAGMMDLIIDKIDSESLCHNFQEQFEYMAQQKELEFKVIDEYKGEILNDKDRLSQVLRNLISNALKFTHKGSITMKIEDSGDNGVKISVSDTGVGIPKDKIETIFEAFKQADGTTSREYGGTGLGLSISLELIKMMKGNISLESKENEGSTFSITIPNIDEKKEDEKYIHVSQENESSEDDRAILNNDDKAFLIIEDDRVFAEILKDKINIKDEYALIAHDGNTGLRLAKEFNIKGILLDLGLPDIDGIDILKELKLDSDLRDIPVYVISGDKRVELTKAYGADGFAKKALTDEDISVIIEEIKALSGEVDTFINRTNDDKQKDKEKVVLNLENKKILVVDDDIRNVYVLIEALNSRGADVITASNGQEAIDALKYNLDTDLVLMDIMMPVMDGYEAVESIKRNKHTRDIPVIAVTAKAMSDDEDKALKAGFDDYVTKPLQMSYLSTIIEAWIKKS